MLKENSVKEFKSNLRGLVIEPGDNGYDDARKVYNGMIHKKPRLIARCVDVADVIRSIDLARENELLLAIRGGGHNAGGLGICDDGLVIDLAAMKYTRVDPAARTVTVGGGCTWGDVDHATHVFGLATPSGIISTTGVGGLTLGGGVGHLTRKCGLTIDNLISADVVLANGSFVKANADENPDLLWALRGGGGNFGVVTSFTFRLHEVTPIMYGGELSYPFADARQLLRGFADVVAAAPDELYVDMAMGTAPQGARWLGLTVCYCGPQADAQRVVAPLRKIGKPLKDQLAVAPYATLQGSADLRGISPLGAYGKGGLVYGITPNLIDTMVEFTESAPSDGAFLWMQHQGGAISRVKPAATAYFNRGASHNVGVFTSWKMPAGDTAREIDWVRRAWAKLEPQTRGQYVNLAASDDREVRVHAAYGDNYPRLAALKKRYDPANLFRLNANIKPA